MSFAQAQIMGESRSLRVSFPARSLTEFARRLNRGRLAVDRARLLPVAGYHAERPCRLFRLLHDELAQVSDLATSFSAPTSVAFGPIIVTSNSDGHLSRIFRGGWPELVACASGSQHVCAANSETTHGTQDGLDREYHEESTGREGQARNRQDWIKVRGGHLGTSSLVQDLPVRAFPCVFCLADRRADRRFAARRRELAAKEHIVAHDVGKGQQAFAPNRRDMTAYRAEQDRLRRAAGAPAAPMPLKAEPVALPPAAAPNPLAALRVAQPLGGGRIVQPRPSNVPRPQPVARPAPRQAAAKTSDGADRSSSEPNSATQDVGEAGIAPSGASNGSATLPASAINTTTSDADEAAAVPPPQPEPPLLPSPACSSYFVEPLSWMSPFLESGVLAGKITCPNKRCGAKLGNFDWAGNRTCLALARRSLARNPRSSSSHAFFTCRMLVRRVGVPWLCAQRVTSGRSLGSIDPQRARPTLEMDEINCKLTSRPVERESERELRDATKRWGGNRRQGL